MKFNIKKVENGFQYSFIVRDDIELIHTVFKTYSEAKKDALKNIKLTKYLIKREYLETKYNIIIPWCYI